METYGEKERHSSVVCKLLRNGISFVVFVIQWKCVLNLGEVTDINTGQ